MRYFKTFFWVFIILSSISSFTYFYAYPKIGRSIFLNKNTQYPGVGQITKTFEANTLIIPRGNAQPFFTQDHPDEYPPEEYETVKIPTQQQILYTVGRFESWVDIPDSADKYIEIKNPKTNSKERYRVSFAASDLFKAENTWLFVENTNYLFFNNKINSIEKPAKANLIARGFTNTKNLFQKGDVVILIPVFDPPALNKKDMDGNYLASKIVIRRVDGVNRIN